MLFDCEAEEPPTWPLLSTQVGFVLFGLTGTHRVARCVSDARRHRKAAPGNPEAPRKKAGTASRCFACHIVRWSVELE
jgi:hypothetical protein